MAAIRSVALVLCTVFAVLGDSAIAAPPAEAPPAGSVSAHAAPAHVVPVVDGSVLDDKAWDAAKVITGFWQTTPDEGQPASENTEVRDGIAQLTARAADEAVARDIIAELAWYDRYLERGHVDPFSFMSKVDTSRRAAMFTPMVSTNRTTPRPISAAW